MNEATCREKYLEEYIEELEISEDLRKRMLDLLDREHKEHRQVREYLSRCQMRIDILERTAVELSTLLAQYRTRSEGRE